MSLLYRSDRTDEVGEVHVYEPHTVGLPRLGNYVRELWDRRQFIYEMARTELRAQHFDTAFGMLWLVLNPLLLGLTYYLLVFIIRGGHDNGRVFMAHLLGALFAYTFFSQSVLKGAASVTGGSKLLLNTSFPRAMLPIAEIATGVLKFIPTLAIYGAIHIYAGLPTNANMLWAIPVFAILVVFTTGLAMLMATLQVYFRDTRSFLPYVLRIWLYLTPILWTVEELSKRKHAVQRVIKQNPMYDIIGAWSQALGSGHRPDHMLMLKGGLWALGVFVVGSLYFVSREREFAVRL